LSNDVVRRQLAKTIKSKNTRIRKLSREEEALRRGAAEIGRKRLALEAEVADLEKHLDSLGGPVAEDPQEATA
jgi:cell division protein FtsB